MKVLYPVCTIFVLKIDIPMDILFLVGGLLLILLGANGLTDGAASVAKRFHIPSIVIGLTIVAFGTSAPELTVSISSALKGSADIAIGNVVGSNTFNTLMIVGCTALFAPIAITRNTLKREILDFAAAAVAKYKIPRGVDFVEALPRSEAGKIQRNKVRAPYWEGRARAI